MKPKNLLLLTLTFILLSGSARADAVADWNALAQSRIFVPASGRPGPSGVIDMAMVHAAIYDAVQAIEGKYEPYYVDVVNVPTANCSTEAAVAQAARDVLVNRFPAQAALINADYDAYLLANGLGGNACLAVGAEAAAGIIALRVGDGAFPVGAPPFIGGLGIGEWRPTSTLVGQTFMNPGPWFGLTRPFMLHRPAQFRSDPPPALNSRRYARDYIEVKNYGGPLGTGLRTPEQTEMALFFSGNFGAQLNGLTRQLAIAHQLDVADSAKLFALATMSNADALITVWNDKWYYNLWRPITAIHNGNLDGNSRTVGDPTWNSLIPSPPYPDYGSGANGITASTAYALQAFFGTDHMSFSIPSVVAASPNTRFYDSFSELRREVVDARVFLGIHFRFADEVSVVVGRRVVNFGNRNFFRRICRKDHDHDRSDKAPDEILD